MGNFSKNNAKTTSNFVLPEADFHDGIIAGLVDLGEVESEWQGVAKVQHKIVVLYYLATEIPSDDPQYQGKRYCQSKTYTFSWSDKGNLFKDFSGGFGSDEFNNADELEVFLGRQVRVLIDHVEKRDGSGKYAKIDGLRPAKNENVTMDGFELPKWIVEANERGEVDAIVIAEQ